MKQNAIKKIPVTIIGIIFSTKNSNIAMTLIKKKKKTGDLHRWPVLKKQCKFMKTNLSKQVTNLFS